jgi:hypothetical protein
MGSSRQIPQVFPRIFHIVKSLGGPAHSTSTGFLAALSAALKVDVGLYKTKKYDIPAATSDDVCRGGGFF